MKLIEQIFLYFQTDNDKYWIYVGEHLRISLLSLTVALMISLPLGYIGSKSPKLSKVCIWLAQFLRIIPSLALLFLLIPLIGVGTLPALIALFVLALPPLVINTTLGFLEVPSNMKDVADGIGMTPFDVFRKIELPEALPFILNGIKLAWVEIISSATLATYIGAGGLGTLIFTGLGLYRMDLLVIGGGSVAIISLVSILLFDLLIRKVRD